MNREQRRAAGQRGPVRSALDEMTGHQMPGGCDDCDAFQTMTSGPDGVYRLDVHHDATCPWFAQHEARRSS